MTNQPTDSLTPLLSLSLDEATNRPRATMSAYTGEWDTITRRGCSGSVRPKVTPKGKALTMGKYKDDPSALILHRSALVAKGEA